ncbi:hypothetical protein SAMN04487900_105141 [Prevotella communis]|uniref:Leucine rich repeat-containing protein n=1 Tax=Prevotella communis TaxID=2913614 RepID=A0A1H0FFF2_9BACT|nr:leucine-rich repeat domain-containing protein [Prevotella communis]SDN93139.1 hypothetical protein SAMN04487900_105141 [Prevotella communis]
MKRIYTSLLVTLMALLIPNTIWAAEPDLENDYTLVKAMIWGDGTNINGSGTCAYTAYDTGNKKQQTLTILTAPENAAGWIAMQAWTDGSGKGWWNRADKGLYCVNAGRSACIFGDDLTTGWLVIFECSQAASNVMSLTNASGEPDGTFSYATSEDGKKFICTITAAENAYVGFCGNKNAGFINKISVYKPNKAVVATTYSVKYVDMEGNTLKENASYDAVAGATIALSDADKANITVGETTYVYDSDDSAEATVAEGGTTVVTVKFHAAANFSYTVNEVCGETNARVTNGTSYETANIKLGYRKYNAVDGQLYKKDATSKEYNYSFKLTQDNQVENIAYAAVEGTNNVVFCAEGEDIEGLTPITEGNTAIRSSNSASAFAPADTKITTLAAGKYKIHAAIYDCASNPNSDWVFIAGAVQVASFNCTTVNIQEFDSQEFAIGRETDLIMLKAGSVSRGLDAIYIVKTGDVTEAEAEVILAKDSLQMDINAAKALDTTGKEGVDALNTAITTAEEALAAAAATVESLNAAKAALAEAVATFIKTTPILTLKATAGEEVTLTFGVWNSEDVFYVDFGNGELQSEKVGIDNKGPVKEDGTTGSATKFTGTVAGDGTIKVYGNNDIWYLTTTNGAMPTTFDQPKLMNVVQMSITGADVESVALPAYPKMTQFSFNNSSAKSVDVTKVPTLTSLTINSTTASKYEPQLESIDLSKNTELTYLSLQGNTKVSGKLTTLDLTNNTKLDGMGLYVQYNALTEIKFGENTLNAINVQNNQLTSLDWTKLTGLKNIYASNNKLAGEADLSANAKFENVQLNNNELTSVKLPDVTKQLAIEGNKLTLATIPAQPAGLNTASKTKKFTYAPQAAMQVAETVSELDLTSQLTVAKGELNPETVGEAAAYTTWLENQTTTFSFVTAGGTALVEGTDYEVTEPGKFKFLKAQEEKVHAVMLNAAFPKFTEAAPFTTTEFTVEAATGEEFEEVKVTYALKEGETHVSADVVEVKNEDKVVATITYGEAGGAEFKAGKADAHVEGFEAFTEGNGTNGDKTSGTFYTIVPKFDGKIDVAVVLNADKKFYILEDGTALADFDGITVSEKKYGTFTFDVKAEKAYKIYAAGTKLGFYGFNYTYKQAKQPEVTELELTLNVERYTGMGYGATEATVDFTEAKAFLGVEAITEDMLSVLNPDGNAISDFKAYDGWFNGEGVAETWGDNTKINVKFFEAIAGEGKYSICDMNGADEVGKTYSVKWQLAANGKKVIYTINVTFVAAPEFKPEIVKTIDVPVYMTAEAAYEGLTAQFDAAEVATALNIASIADAKAYIVNVTTGSFVENTTDGWRDANGDATQWPNATNGLCAKIQEPSSGTIDYLGTHDANFMENDTYTAKWGFVANEKAVVLNINITFKSAAFMTRINSMKSDSQQGTIYNLNGQKVNKAQKGLNIINGKKIVIK